MHFGNGKINVLCNAGEDTWFQRLFYVRVQYSRLTVLRPIGFLNYINVHVVESTCTITVLYLPFRLVLLMTI